MKQWILILLAVIIVGGIFVSCTEDDGSTEPTNNDPIPIEMVFVQGGTFDMGDHLNEGSTDELPVHSVTVSDFSIGKYEVTQSQWASYMPVNFLYAFGIGNNYPVYFVSWYNIIAYCNKISIAEGLTPCYTISNSTDPDDWGSTPASLNATWDAVICNWAANGYRLPTEAEWEYAARGGTNWDDNYSFSGSNTIGDVAWCSSNSGFLAHSVGTKSPNQLGIYDMMGNMIEWCWDWYVNDYYETSPSVNPTGPASGLVRIIRGGFWNSDDDCRVAFRAGLYNYSYQGYLGFRVVKTP